MWYWGRLERISRTDRVRDKCYGESSRRGISYSSFGTWWHTVTHGKGSEGETGEWSG